MTTTPPPAIEVTGLRKGFGETVALTDLDLRVEPGTVYALLGPNGAGKTTLVRILATLLRPDAGKARVSGYDVTRDPRAVRRSIGVTGQFSAVDELLTGRENLRLVADLAHLPRTAVRGAVADQLARFDLEDAADRRVATYSGGMRRRLDLAMTLLLRPQLVFLDEPTTGLDPRSRRELWETVRGQVAAGGTVLLTTQYLEEADALADRVGVLDGGRLVAEGTPEQLKRRVPGAHVLLDLPGGGRRSEPFDGTLAALREVVARVEEPDARVEVRTPGLDDVFLALTGSRPSADQRTDEEVPA